MSRQQVSISTDLEDFSRPKESPQKPPDLKPHHRPCDHQQQVSLPSRSGDLSHKSCPLAAGWSPNQEVLWWVLSSFWHLLFGSETQSSQTSPTIKMDGRSNKFSSVFGIKTLIKEEEEHLSPGGKDRAPASPAPCPQSRPATGPHASRLTTTCPPGMFHPQPPPNIHPLHQGHISRSDLLRKDLKVFGSCCTTKHFPGFYMNISVPGEPINTRQQFRHRGRRGLEDAACQFSRAVYKCLRGVCCKQKPGQILLIKWDLPISLLTAA